MVDLKRKDHIEQCFHGLSPTIPSFGGKSSLRPSSLVTDVGMTTAPVSITLVAPARFLRFLHSARHNHSQSWFMVGTGKRLLRLVQQAQDFKQLDDVCVGNSTFPSVMQASVTR